MIILLGEFISIKMAIGMKETLIILYHMAMESIQKLTKMSIEVNLLRERSREMVRLLLYRIDGLQEWRKLSRADA
jgi:hypothetical protein